MNLEEMKQLSEMQRCADDALSVPVMIDRREQANIIINDLVRKWKVCSDREIKDSIENVLISYFLTPAEFDVIVTLNLTAQEYARKAESQA